MRFCLSEKVITEDLCLIAHGLSMERLAAAARALEERGSIEFLCGRPRGEWGETSPFTDGAMPAAAELVEAWWSFRMTERGALAWAGYARPDWNRCVVLSRSSEGRHRLTGLDRDHVRRLYEYRRRRIWGGPRDVEPQEGVTQPFQPTYWKSFPDEAHWIECEVFPYQRAEEGLPPEREPREYYRALSRWHTW